MAKIGKDGVISVEKSNNFGINVEVQKGMRFDHGFINPEFADNMGTMTAELVEPYILITDYRLADNFRFLKRLWQQDILCSSAAKMFVENLCTHC